MSSKIRNVALLLPAFVLATGLAFAQPSVKVTTVDKNGAQSSTNITTTTPNGPGTKAPTQNADGTLKYWDGLGIGGTSTNYFTVVPYITATPNPQIATGPDDILTIVNRTVSRYPNPNAAGNTGTLNPYNYPPTEFIPLDVWMGLTVLGTQAGGGALCPSGTGSNSNCVIDNASIRYDQLQGRFIVLFTVTDLPAHRSNWVLLVSRFAQLQQCATPPTVGGPVCQTPIFTPPVIAPIVGGNQTGGQNPINWVLYKIPINLQYNPFQQPNALGLVNNPGAPAPFNIATANSAVGTLNTITTGGVTGQAFLTTPFCPNGGPTLPLTFTNGNQAGGTGRTCTNYYPTGARFGIDNDNIILTAPVLDQAYAPNEGNFPAGPCGISASVASCQGPYAGTRVTTIAKLAVYNGISLVLDQPPVCTAANPVSCMAVNLSDDAATGTLTEIAQKVAFGQGAVGTNGKQADLKYVAGPSTTSPTCFTSAPAQVLAFAIPPAVGAPVLSCAPTYTVATVPGLTRALPAIFWEPDNLRGRALASFDAQVAPFGSAVSGIITPLDYLVGTEITDNFGQTALAPGGAPALTTSPTGGNCATQPQPGCPGIVSQGVPGVTGQPGVVPGGTIPLTAGIATIYYIQPIVFSCPAGNLFGKTSSVVFCGAGDAQSLVAEVPLLGALFRNVSTLAQVADPSPVGQGFGGGVDPTGKKGTQLTTSPSNVPVSDVSQDRIFVGDSRPEQVMFREGLLYVARNVRLADQQINWLGTSTVLYDIIKTCATLSAQPAASICGLYDPRGANLTNPQLAFEYEWFNGLNVSDPNGDVLGFGFYQPMFEVPADVVATGPVSPISTLQLFDKLFVGMTTGGTSNTLGTFSRDYPSLWDFRPGDDAFDTVEPYLDPYTGVVLNSYNGVCGNAVTQPGTAAVVATLISPGTSQLTVASSAGLAINQTIQSGTPVATTFNTGTVSVTAASTTNASTTPVGNVKTNAFTCLSVVPNIGVPPPVDTGCTTASTGNFGVSSLTNIGLSEAVIGARGPSVTTNTVLGSNVISVPNTTQIAIGEWVEAPGVIPQIGNPTLLTPCSAAIAGPCTTTFVTGILVNPDNTLQVTLSNPALVTGTSSVVFDSSPCFGPNNTNPAVGSQRVTNTTNASTFVVNGVTVPGVTYNGTLACTSFYADSTGINAGPANATPQLGPINSLLGQVINNGIPVTFLGSSLVPNGTQIINIVGNTVTLNNPAIAPLPGLAAGITTTNIPINFQNGSTSGATVVCPLIPFSPRGGASTDPNDGSLWLYGEFAKNRLSTVPGPGQWGTSVANYALSFPAVDPYGNDNTYFVDVQPTGSPNSAFFTWIQLAKNLGLAVPASLSAPTLPTGCTANGGAILQPPPSGTQPIPGPSQLACPTFGSDTVVNRAEMAYWVVRSQMDETQVGNYLCATGGDPTGIATCPGNGAVQPQLGFSYADFGAVVSPFLQPTAANAALGIAGVSTSQVQRYIEVMIRRGYTKGCSATNDPQFAYCPTQPVTRNQMAVFLIRAKMNNVFPTTLSGIPLAAPYGDNFGVFTPTTQYFSDVPADSFAPFIQKMRELRITNGTGGATFSPNNPLTRKEIATFIVRAFFL